MTDDLVAKALDQIAYHEGEAMRLKAWVNDADRLSGQAPRFDDVTMPTTINMSTVGQSSAKRWQPKPGDYLGKPLATAVKNILVARFEAAGNSPSPATVDEIHDAMTQGSFNFETSGVESQKAGIRISLGKNTVAFVRLPNTDSFGLLEWYPGLKRTGVVRRRFNGDQSASPGDDSAAGDEEAAGDAAAVLTPIGREGR